MWQAGVIVASGFGALQAWWDRVVRQWQWGARMLALDHEQQAVIERVIATMQGPWWDPAKQKVRICATTPKFHQAAQWVDYGRALKANAGQAQNVFRHIKVVHELHADAAQSQQALTNPEAHLVTELAYQGMASIGRVN